MTDEAHEDAPWSAAESVAVMQPYFYPYAGYFRLLAVCGTFIILDNVQFPRRGRVHRCEMPRAEGGTEWLTLPLARQPRETHIRDLMFANNARASLDRRLGRHPLFAHATTSLGRQVLAHLQGPLGSVADFLEAGLRLVTQALGLRAQIVRSSSFDLDPGLRRQDRVISLVRAAGGRIYVNAPGGGALYDSDAFQRAGIELRFLEPYTGPFRYLLPALIGGDVADLRTDVSRSASCTTAPR